MRRTTTEIALIAALCIAATASVASYWKSSELIERLSMSEDEPKTTSWKFKLGNGVATHVVTTYRRENESDDAWTARHAAIVASDAAEFIPLPD